MSLRLRSRSMGSQDYQTNRRNDCRLGTGNSSPRKSTCGVGGEGHRDKLKQCPLYRRKQTSRETYRLTCTKPLRGKKGDCCQFKPELPDFWESREVRGRSLSTRPLIASSSDASAERDVDHQASQPSRTGHRDGRGIPYRGAIHTQDRST
jgi:hypothetical protein